MAHDVKITGNELSGGRAEGLDAEGSTDIEFSNNNVFSYADGITLFGLNRNIKFKNNTVSASVSAFRNASSTFYADYGLVEFDGNSFKSTAAATIAGTISAAGRVHITNNRFENVKLVASDTSIAELIFSGNKVYYDYAPSGPWLLRVGGLATGYTNQPKQSRGVIHRNLFEWRGAGIMGRRAIGLTSSPVAVAFDIQKNTFIGIGEQVSYEGSAAAMSVLVKNNTFDAAAQYPSVLHGSSTGLYVIWQDNSRSDGLDAYGTNTPPSSFFFDGSRIWSNTPANGAAPGWVRRSGAWGPMAVSNR